MRRAGLWARLFLSHLAVIAVGAATLFVVVSLVAPSAFDAAMGHAMGLGMGDMMLNVVRQAFSQAAQISIGIAVVVAAAAAGIVSLAASQRVVRPIRRLVTASRRIAAGHYAERVPDPGGTEVGDLARSFNTMAEALETTERRRLALVGDVAHELRTPLATVQGYLEGLEDGVIKPDGVTWGLLRGETSRLTRLVDDLQELWRAEAQEIPLQFEDLDAGRQIAAAAQRFEAPAKAHRIGLVQRLPGESVRIHADPERVAQILDNFLTNAIRYTPSDTSVTLSAAVVGQEVVLSVADGGPGLTSDQLGHIFDRFYRADPSRSRALGGSGIGLAIARALAIAMGGHAEAASRGPGQGATFSLVLPRLGPQPEGRAAQRS